MKRFVLAPHLDDEIIGCFDIVTQNKDVTVVYFSHDYREKELKNQERSCLYVSCYDFDLGGIKAENIVYIPSKFDLHPLHKKVNVIGRGLNCQKLFYSVEMNVPWLQLEDEPEKKRALFEALYPGEDMKNDKYFLFKSIVGFDDIIFASVVARFEAIHCYPSAPEKVAFLRNPHRHEFHVELRVQQYHDARDLEYFLLQRSLKEFIDSQTFREKTSISSSCEQMAQVINDHFMTKFHPRLIEVSVKEDGENGVILK